MDKSFELALEKLEQALQHVGPGVHQGFDAMLQHTLTSNLTTFSGSFLITILMTILCFVTFKKGTKESDGYGSGDGWIGLSIVAGVSAIISFSIGLESIPGFLNPDGELIKGLIKLTLKGAN